MSTYPKADTRAQWFGDNYAGSRMNPNCGCLHTTEGTSWPSYSGGATAPNLTGLPLIREKRIAWRQHYSDEVSARALQNDSGGVETNTANVVQVELIGTCDPGTRDRWKRAGLTPGEDFIYWPEAPEWALREVAEMVADYNRRHGIRIDGPAVWKAYPASYGEANSNRFTFAEWRSFYGWCGHQHIPENSHGDPGALDWPAIERMAKEIVGDQPEPTKPTKPRPDFTIAHCSGLWDAPVETWREAVAATRDAKATVLTLTETTRDGIMRAVTPKGWGFDRLDDQPGQSECSIMWAKRAWDDAGQAYPTRLAQTRFKTSKGFLRPPVTALTKPLRHKKTGQVVLFTTLHAPSGVQGKTGFKGTKPRLTAHCEAVETVHEAWDRGKDQHPDAARVLTGDFNVDYRLPWVREWWDKEFPLLTPCFEGDLPQRGTHGRRVIDWLAASPQLQTVSARVLPTVDGFDHRPIVVRYSVTSS